MVFTMISTDKLNEASGRLLGKYRENKNKYWKIITEEKSYNEMFCADFDSTRTKYTDCSIKKKFVLSMSPFSFDRNKEICWLVLNNTQLWCINMVHGF